MQLRNSLLALVAVLFCTASLSATTIEHTWVSWTGSDTNPCTSTSPCLTFQGALTNTTAGGIITAKDAGDFGAVSTSQSVTIDGNNLGSMTFSTVGVNITATANVTLRNLTIDGLDVGNFGVYANYGGTVIIDNCKITNITFANIFFGGKGELTVENSRIEALTAGYGNGYGIELGSTGAENAVVRNTVIDVSPMSLPNFGFYTYPGSGPVMASLQNVTIMGAGNGAVYSNSGNIQITNSVLTQSAFGVVASDGSTVSVANSLITNNTNGVCSGTSSKIRLDNNDIYDNATAIANCSGIVKTSTTNKTSGTISIPASDVSDSVTF